MWKLENFFFIFFSVSFWLENRVFRNTETVIETFKLRTIRRRYNAKAIYFHCYRFVCRLLCYYNCCCCMIIVCVSCYSIFLIVIIIVYVCVCFRRLPYSLYTFRFVLIFYVIVIATWMMDNFQHSLTLSLSFGLFLSIVNNQNKNNSPLVAFRLLVRFERGPNIETPVRRKWMKGRKIVW